MSAFRSLQVPGDWDSLGLKSHKNGEVPSRMSFQVASSSASRMSYESICSQRQMLVLTKGPGSHPPQLEDAGCRHSELPVIHLQVFQVCHQAEESTVILRLAALKIGDGSHWAEQLRQSLRSTSLDLRERAKLDMAPIIQVPGHHRTFRYQAIAPAPWCPGVNKERKESVSQSFRSMAIPLVQTGRGRIPNCT